MNIDYKFNNVKDKQIYSISYIPDTVKGVVLFIDTIFYERNYSYHMVNEWGKYLQRNDYALIRFDYAGVGESTGNLEDIEITEWEENILFFVNNIKCKYGRPLILHGFRFGGLLALNIIGKINPDAIILWDPPKTLRKMLEKALRLKIIMDMREQSPEKKTIQDYIYQIENSGAVEIDGYPLTKKIWEASERLKYMEPEGDNVLHIMITNIFSLKRSIRIAVNRPPFWMHNKLVNHELEELFKVTLNWLKEKKWDRDEESG